MTPLAIIRGNISELLTPEASSWSKSQINSRYLNIETSSTRLLILLQNIMIISAIEQGSMKISLHTSSLTDLIDNCIASFHHLALKQQITIKFNRPSGMNSVMAEIDQEKLRQSLTNIIDNSIKFTKSGGAINVNLTEDQTKYQIDVADSGIGISKNEMGDLFTRFHRGTSYLNFDYEGVGLGLYIAKYLIEANGGRIYVSSEKNRGTCVTILLPK
jgi:signal transduction histidine kinase